MTIFKNDGCGIGRTRSSFGLLRWGQRRLPKEARAERFWWYHGGQRSRTNGRYSLEVLAARSHYCCCRWLARSCHVSVVSFFYRFLRGSILRVTEYRLSVSVARGGAGGGGEREGLNEEGKGGADAPIFVGRRGVWYFFSCIFVSVSCFFVFVAFTRELDPLPRSFSFA